MFYTHVQNQHSFAAYLSYNFQLSLVYKYQHMAGHDSLKLLLFVFLSDSVRLILRNLFNAT